MQPLIAIDAASGEGQDSHAVCIVQPDARAIRVLTMREWTPPFDALAVAAEVVTLHRDHGARAPAWVDAYGLGLIQAIYRRAGLATAKVPLDTSATLGAFRALHPRIHGLRDLDGALRDRLRTQLEQLVVRPAQRGRESISHPGGAHDDLAVALARAAVMCDRIYPVPVDPASRRDSVRVVSTPEPPPLRRPRPERRFVDRQARDPAISDYGEARWR